MSSTEATRKGSASPPGEGAAEDKGGGNLLPEVQFGRGEVRVRGKFRVMDRGREGRGKSWGSPAGRLGPVHPTTCLSTCSQGGGSTYWGNGEEVARALPWVAVLHTS